MLHSHNHVGYSDSSRVTIALIYTEGMVLSTGREEFFKRKDPSCTTNAYETRLREILFPKPLSICDTKKLVIV